jgi:hypothetical protein
MTSAPAATQHDTSQHSTSSEWQPLHSSKHASHTICQQVQNTCKLQEDSLIAVCLVTLFTAVMNITVFLSRKKGSDDHNGSEHDV